MNLAVQTFSNPAAAAGAASLNATMYRLGRADGDEAIIWPALGFNCLHWRHPHGKDRLDLLYVDPDLFHNGRPTRSGIPVLFPFPNRIRAGRFSWAGKEYQLPLEDPKKANAIHGFAVRHPWRVIDQGAGSDQAWLTGEFQCSIDAPECLPLWPADHRLRLTYRLGRGWLRLEAEVTNPDSKPLPFGLGYHPYFQMPFLGGRSADECTVQVPARRFWQLQDNLPTGDRPAVDAARDLNQPRPFASLHVDDVLTDLPGLVTAKEGSLYQCATLNSPPGVTLRISCSKVFRDLVVFVPPHRQAFCVEPYTCTTDAINLQQRGIDAGLLVLPGGGTWSAVVEMRVE